MLHNLRHQPPIPDHTLHLLRQRPLLIIILLRPPRQHHIHARAQTRKHLRPQTLPAQIHRRPIHLIQHDRRQHAQHLHLELRALDDVNGGHEAVDDEREAGAVVDGDGVGFAGDADGGFGAAGDEDRLVDGDGQLNHLGGFVEVLDDPLVAVEVFARGFLGPHALGFGLLAWERQLDVA